MALSLASIHVHPIKSLGGYAVAEARLTDRGLEHDRRWMLVDDNGRFLSQREVATMACLHVSPLEEGFRVTDLRDGATLDLPHAIDEGPRREVTVWNDTVETIAGASAWDAFFSERLERTARLVFMPDETKRLSDPKYTHAVTSLSDDFPYLLISQASLDELNARLAAQDLPPVPMDRFRPNLVIAGGEPFQEDDWRTVRIGDAQFQLVKPCARCVITTTDQRTGERGKEPLRTLATFRNAGNKVLFGMNAVGDGQGLVRVGDALLPA